MRQRPWAERGPISSASGKDGNAAQRMMNPACSGRCRGPSSNAQAARAVRTRERLTREAAKDPPWLAEHPEDRKGAKRRGQALQPAPTTGQSAKMATSRRDQGYTGVATVDSKAQVVLDAQAHGTGSEQELLLGAVEGAEPIEATRRPSAPTPASLGSEPQDRSEHGIDAWICDNQYRTRDPRYAGQEHKTKLIRCGTSRRRRKRHAASRRRTSSLPRTTAIASVPAGRRSLKRLELQRQGLRRHEISRSRARLPCPANKDGSA